ncbi:Lrp/AsnC family transcriptional regulator [Ideonella sp. A 288]|uniref:Lrp/AsnC family transcriptional regulator n=1 Tax=Ideonella sp. A 288 TaxID=1962181 RepID=UPI000B4BB064|nr:Lrp/AsnC family transcriptional regulator [Ideonella sp. A 288]
MNKNVATSGPIDLDATDLRLLELLQADASRSNLELAAAAHVSPATCLRRVKRLVEAGVIERRVALLSIDRLGAGVTALVELSLDRQGAEHLDRFEARALADPQVQQCYRVSPGPDFMLVVWAADMAGYHALVQRLFTEDANVRNVKAFFSVKRAKFDPAIGLGTARPGGRG